MNIYVSANILHLYKNILILCTRKPVHAEGKLHSPGVAGRLDWGPEIDRGAPVLDGGPPPACLAICVCLLSTTKHRVH